MFPVRKFEEEFRKQLTVLDELKDNAEDDVLDQMEELNATFEDALFVMECIDEQDEDWQEAFSDALEEIKDLCKEYRKLADELPELSDVAAGMESRIFLAENNMNG